MATISASIPTPSITSTAVALKRATTVSSPIIGLPQIGVKGGRVRCSSSSEEKAALPRCAGMGTSLLAATSVMSMSSPALALVDERMSTEGTGLSLGVSNNLLGWILVGVFALIWALYFVYTSTLEEDEESGLSL